MMPTLTSTLLILLTSTSVIQAFAPPRHRASPSPRRFAPHDLSSLILTLDDAVIDGVSAASDLVAAATSSVEPPTSVETVADSVSASSSSFNPSYSKASYYTTLALYVASFPGLWSQIKRSTKAKVKRKTYVR